MEVYSDSDWAGCSETRKSTSGGCILLQGVPIHGWSRTQSIVALSSGEAEYVALTVAAAEVSWVAELLKELGVPCKRPIAHTDSAAAKDMCKKQLSKVKHMEMRYYFLKNLVEDGRIELRKVGSEEHPADLFTKFVNEKTLGKLRWYVAESATPSE